MCLASLVLKESESRSRLPRRFPWRLQISADARREFQIDDSRFGEHDFRIMKTLLVCPLLLLPAVLAAEPTVSLAGLQVVYDDGEKEFDGFKTFNMDKGHKVALIVRSKDKAMVGFDEDKASITLGGAKAECRFFSGMGFSKDRRTLKLEFDTEEKPQLAADGGLLVKGSLPIVLATGKEETRSEAFTVEKGAVVVFPADKEGVPALKVKSAGKTRFGDAKFEIAFSTNRKMDGFAGVSFHTKDGKRVESDEGGSSWMGFGGKGSGEVSYQFEAEQKELILALETWTGREEKTLEVDIKAGLALP
jgi:hypothetical protein